jgi:hypothetical protein
LNVNHPIMASPMKQSKPVGPSGTETANCAI